MGWTMVWAQAVDAVEVLRYNGRVSEKGGGRVLRQLKYFQSVVRLRSCSQAIEENYLSQSAISQHPHALVANDELHAIPFAFLLASPSGRLQGNVYVLFSDATSTGEEGVIYKNVLYFHRLSRHHLI